MFISMLSTYLYNMGAPRRLWMPFWPPFLTACKHHSVEGQTAPPSW